MVELMSHSVLAFLGILILSAMGFLAVFICNCLSAEFVMKSVATKFVARFGDELWYMPFIGLCGLSLTAVQLILIGIFT